MIEKYIGCMLLSSIGDTIGYKNGEWEFNFRRRDINFGYSDEILFHFIELGGINDINMKGWIVSDDTVMHMATAKALLSNFKSNQDLYQNLAKEYIKTEKLKVGRNFGNRTLKSIGKLNNIEKNNKLWDTQKYDHYGGGSGGAMRSMCIGLLFAGNKSRKKLIKTSLEAGRITHNNVVGYFGSIVSAIFTAYAIEKIDINLWPFKLLKILEDTIIDDYIKESKNFKDYKEKFYEDKIWYIDQWKRYIELRFSGKTFKKIKFMRQPFKRSEFYFNNFSWKGSAPGFSGHDSVIVSYDALQDAGKSWEKLVVYSMLHMGDSDTTGTIGAAWYGALYGYEHIPKNNYKHLEFKDEIINLGKKIYHKYRKINEKS